MKKNPREGKVSEKILQICVSINTSSRTPMTRTCEKQPKEQLFFKADYGLKNHVDPRLTSAWHTCGAEANRNAKAVNTERTLSPPPTRGGKDVT